MPRDIGAALPPEVVRRLGGDEIDRHAEKVVLAFSVGADGWPHPAMLSYFEVVALGSRALRLAPYADSRTTANLRRNGRLTLAIVDEGVACYVKGRVRAVRERMETLPHAALLECRVESVLVDEADPEREGGAAVSGGVTFRDPRLARRLDRAAAVFQEMRTP